MSAEKKSVAPENGLQSEEREKALAASKKQLENGLADSEGRTLSEEEQDFFWLCGKR